MIKKALIVGPRESDSEASSRLREAGYVILTVGTGARALIEALNMADVVALLPGWESSVAGRTVAEAASSLGVPAVEYPGLLLVRERYMTGMEAA